MESAKIQTAVAVKLEKVSPQPSPDTLTPEMPELPSGFKDMNGATPPSTVLMTPPSFPKRLSSLNQSGKDTQPTTITESLSEDEDLADELSRKDSAQANGGAIELEGDAAAVAAVAAVFTTEKEEDHTAGGIEVSLRQKGKVDELLVTAFFILLLVFIFYNPLSVT